MPKQAHIYGGLTGADTLDVDKDEFVMYSAYPRRRIDEHLAATIDELNLANGVIMVDMPRL